MATKSSPKIIVGIGVTACALASGFALAATQGSLGSTSTGTININSIKGAAIQISGLTDISFPSSATTPAPIESTACVYATTGSYTVLATSSHPSGSTFRLMNGTNFINYGVGWYPVNAGGTAIPLSSGSVSGSQGGADTTSTTCGGGSDSRLAVTIDSTTFVSAPTGTYSDTLTLLVAPV